MKEKPESPRLVLFYVKLPLVLNNKDIFKQSDLTPYSESFEAIYSRVHFSKFDDTLTKHCGSNYIKLGEGAFLIEEDICYSAILSLVGFCNANRLQYVVAPISDAPVSLPPNYQDLTKWLGEKGKCFRLTGFPEQQSPKKP